MELYVFLIAILAILSEIGVFSLKNSIEVIILEPAYSFNLKKIIGLLNENRFIEIKTKSNIFKELADSDTNKIAFGTFNIGGLENKNNLPYEMNIKYRNFSGISSNTSENFPFRFGLTNESSSMISSDMNDSALRTSEQKRRNISYLLESSKNVEANRVTDEVVSQLLKMNYKLPEGQYFVFSDKQFSKNPLNEILELKYLIDSNTYDKFVNIFDDYVSVYTPISISNYNSDDIEGIEVFINDAIPTGKLELMGWTAFTPVVYSDSSKINEALYVPKLKANKSIEILFKGEKQIRMTDILISVNKYSNYNKRLILSIMFYLFLGVMLIYLILEKWLPKMQKNGTQNKEL